MGWFIGLMFAGSALLFLLSFLGREDDNKQTKDEIEQVSLSFMGETYHIKQRLSRLEEELLSASPTSVNNGPSESRQDLMKEAYILFEQGHDVKSISQKMNMKEDEIKYLLTKLQ
ncbi:hypothetical protein [Alteribacillus sp. HJP-4]|uniref:hypothetical protein n=1 Tax=Alteribacillus sp. HJP-4 TaxID=2775394 RepID=UPI0035CCE799